MIIEYGKFSEKKKKQAENILNSLPYRYCFITGSFLFKENYKDIDIFVVTRSKKEVTLKDKRINLTKIDFNDLHSLFYHSLKKECIAKNILPEKPLKVTVAQYWDVINEAIPMLLNEKDKYHKEVRDLVLYTEYFKNGKILGSIELMEVIGRFKGYNEILDYVNENVKKIVPKEASKGYIKRFFYTQAGQYKDMQEYDAQGFLYNLSHAIISKVA